ncbi:MAG TPA: hypothetical protein VKA65_14600 [Acidimicrobiales bacterium]|nr:hypothetical protein [Acidimicrobiales bacterium]
MSDPTRIADGSPSAVVAAQLIRLLGATVDVLADGYDPLEGEEPLRRATSAASVALRGLAAGDADDIERGLVALTAVVASTHALL